MLKSGDTAYRCIGEGLPLVILHGLYGCGDNWMGIARKLAETWCVWMPDARNHGGSAFKNTHTYNDMSEDVLSFIRDNSINRPVLLGHSMGGKTALHFAARYGDMISGLVVADIAPVSYSLLSDYSQGIIDHLNIMEALYGLELSDSLSRQDIDASLKPVIPDSMLRGFLLKNLCRSKDNGRWEWKINLKILRSFLPEILNGMDNFMPENISVSLPVLFLKGGKSGYIGVSEADYIIKNMPNAKIKTCPDAGHWIHADNPEWVVEAITNYGLRIDCK